MKIYFAASAPGNEEKVHKMIKKRLLSFYLIKKKILECDKILQKIKK